VYAQWILRPSAVACKRAGADRGAEIPKAEPLEIAPPLYKAMFCAKTQDSIVGEPYSQWIAPP
jgi:hypothetical protein